MQSTEDKDKIMARLVKLRNAEEQYKSIYVKDNYILYRYEI